MYRAEGCDNCLGSGYQGRIGIFELLELTEEMSAAILQQKSESDLVQIARASGFQTLLESAVKKIYAGETSPEEILETIMSEE